jgi:DNA-binding transcriptional regulator YiaG
MPNIAAILKAEIARVARKEVRAETAGLKKSVSTHRSEIAALKRLTRVLEQQLHQRPRAAPTSAVANTQDADSAQRFSAKSLVSQRKRLGLSVTACGLLLGTSAQSIYNWEQGKSRPLKRHLPAIFALRNLGKKEAAAIVQSRTSET